MSNTIRLNQHIVRAIGSLSRIRKGDHQERVDAMDVVIAKCESELACDGASAEDIRVRLFALCAFCDEVLISTFAHDALLRYSQMRKRFDNVQAGIDFFRIAQELSDRNDGAFMVYWLVFRCGFRGYLEGAAQDALHWENCAREKVLQIASSIPGVSVSTRSAVRTQPWGTLATGALLVAVVGYGVALSWIRWGL